MAKVIPIATTPRIPSASYSRLQVFESCKQRARLKFADRIPEPEWPLRPGQTERPNDRGTRIHNNAELFIKGHASVLTPELKPFTVEYERLREMYKDGMVTAEEDWAMTSEWEITDWKAPDAWLRLKMDTQVMMSETESVVVDLKTGRRQGNEIKHTEQLQLYQLVAFLRNPELQTVHAELWYPDCDELHRNTYNRDMGLRYKVPLTKRLTDMTNYIFTNEQADANPNIFTCKYCMYGSKGNGMCKRGM